MLMSQFTRDLQHGLRILGRRPGFAAVIISTLALGIGANSAVFSVVNAVLLRPLPYQDASGLVVPWGEAPQLGFDEIPLSYPNYLDLKTGSHSLAGFGVFSPQSMNLAGKEGPEPIAAVQTSVDLLPLLGVAPAAGRTFAATEGVFGGEHVAVLGHGLAQRLFGGDAQAVGKTLILNELPFRVVGVMPKGFSFPPAFTAVGTKLSGGELWTPLAPNPATEERGNAYLFPVARLDKGVTVRQAAAELKTIAKRLEKQYPETNTGIGLKVVSLRDQVVGKVELILVLLLGAVSFVLLIACANVANLLLALALAREKEFAVRSALGASRRRMLGQLVGENLPLGVLGGLVGLLVAYLGLRLLVLYGPEDVPRLRDAAIDGRVLLVTLLLSLLTGVIFGLVPARKAVRLHLAEALKEGARASSDRISGLLRQTLGVTEVAFALLLLVGAGLMVKSLLRLTRVDLGFNPDRVLTMELTPGRNYAGAPMIIGFYRGLAERLRALPGVQSVGATSVLPLGGADQSTGFFIENRQARPGETFDFHYRTVVPGYFQTLAIPVRQGRALADTDNETARQVIVINQTMARRFWPGQDPIGKRIAIDLDVDAHGGDRGKAWREVVGVVADVRHAGLDATAKPEGFTPIAQGGWRIMNIVVRGSADASNLAGPVRQAIRDLDRQILIAKVMPMEQLVSRAVSQPRFNGLLFALFAALAAILGSVGIYGVVSHLVAERTHEIGIRMALGANRRDVARTVGRQVLWLVLVGLAIGLSAALALSRFLRSLLFEVSPSDPATLASAVLLILVMVIVASFIPTRRAVQVDPVAAIRRE
jgi:predicted permease